MKLFNGVSEIDFCRGECVNVGKDVIDNKRKEVVVS